LYYVELKRQDAFEGFLATSNHHLSLLAPQSSSGYSQSSLKGSLKPGFDRSFSESSQGSVVILRHSSPSCQTSDSIQFSLPNTSKLNVYYSDHEVEVDRGTSTTTLQEYKERLSRGALTAVISKKDMINVLCNHVRFWKALAKSGFGLSDIDVHHIDSDNYKDGVKECAWQAYQKYIKKRPSATEIYITEILEVFYKAGEHEAIEALIETIEAKVNQ